jgi:hypothetical protein
MTKTADNVKTIQANLGRNDFTLHRLHLNISGKEKMVELIGENLKKLTARKKRNPHHSEMGGKSKGSYLERS